VFLELFPDPEKARRRAKADGKGRTAQDPYAGVVAHFDDHAVELPQDAPDAMYTRMVQEVPGLEDLVRSRHAYLDAAELPVWMEFVLHGLAELSRVGRADLDGVTRFSDLMGSVFSGEEDGEAGDR